MEGIEDKILLYKVRVNRDPDAYGLLYDKYVASIYRYVFFKLSHKEEAEDVTSEIFLKAWRHIIDATGESEIINFRTFIYRVARNSIVDVYRERVKKKNYKRNTRQYYFYGLWKNYHSVK